MQDKIRQSIEQALTTLGFAVPTILVEHPADMSHGEWATSVALVVAKKLGVNPQETAKQILVELVKNQLPEVAKMEVAGPGFINFYLTSEYYAEQIEVILQNAQSYGHNDILANQKTVVEYTDPNPFKSLHIGHLMSNAIGESIARVLEANGANVIRACYQGDVGLHVAKTIYGVEEILKTNPDRKKEFFGNWFGFGKNPAIWGEAYARGATLYEADESAKTAVVTINKKIYDKSDKVVNKIYDVGRQVSLAEFEKNYTVLGTKFNEYFFESETWKFGLDLVKSNITNGIFAESDGAVVFKGEDYGLHTRVFVNREGLPTYEAKELGLAKLKYDRTQYDKSIVITANEQTEYFKVILAALKLLFPDLAAKTTHLGHGMMRLPTGKMSSRTGQVIVAESLLAELQNKVLEKMADRQMSDKEKTTVAEVVAVAALKFSILRQATGKDVIFELEKALSFEGDSGPYLQYSYVRAMSLLAKAKTAGLTSEVRDLPVTDLGQVLLRYPEVVARAGAEYMPHHIATYLIDLAGTFNTFYGQGKIVDTNATYKVALTEAFAETMKNGLALLGIKVPNKM